MVARITIGEGKYQIEGIAVSCGADINVSVYGGEKAHIGAVSLAEFETERNSATVSTITKLGHRDDYISSQMAKILSAALHCTVSVSCGVHIEKADADDLKQIIENCKKMAVEFCNKLQK